MSSIAVQPRIVGGQMHLLTPAEKDQLALEIVQEYDLFVSAQESFARGRALAEEARIKKAQAEEHAAKAAAHEAAATEARAQQERIIKVLSVNVFCETFHGKVKLPPAIIERVFERYLDQGRVISVLLDPVTHAGYFEVKTTVSFARYLAENPGKVTNCNFTLFREIMDNMRAVAQVLAQPTCSVKVVRISSGISEEAKTNLEAAKLARGEALTINYV